MRQREQCNDEESSVRTTEHSIDTCRHIFAYRVFSQIHLILFFLRFFHLYWSCLLTEITRHGREAEQEERERSVFNYFLLDIYQ